MCKVGVGGRRRKIQRLYAEVGMEENVCPLSHTLLILMREM
jgi:hypothetical protein